MSRPIDLPSMEHWPHGVRARYVCGCRCDLCRRANTEYARERAAYAVLAAKEHAPRRTTRVCVGIGGAKCGRKLRVDSVGGRCRYCRTRIDADDLVNALRARRHLAALSAAGVGYKAVAAACDVGKSILREIATGEKRCIRRSTLARILSVDEDAVCDAARVDAAPTWAFIEEMLALGLTKTAIAKRLGLTSIQFRRDQVLARNALRVRKLRDAIVGEHEERMRAIRESCHCERPMLLDRATGVVCARCERAVLA